MMPYVTRRYQDADLGRLHEIDKACFPVVMAYSRAELRFYLNHPGAITLVAEKGGDIVGFVTGLVRRDTSGHVITLDVVAEVRRQGIGRALMSCLHREFLLRDVTVAVLEVSVENLAARSFYESIGYEYAEIIRGYYGGQIDACRMTRRMEGAGDRA